MSRYSNLIRSRNNYQSIKVEKIEIIRPPPTIIESKVAWISVNLTVLELEKQSCLEVRLEENEESGAVSYERRRMQV